MPLRYSVVLAPPFICGSSGIRLRLSSTPLPQMPPNLCGAKLSVSIPEKSTGMRPMACVASTCRRQFGWSASSAAISVNRLDGAELAVHRADGDEHRVRAQQLAHLLRVNRAIPSDGEQVDLPAALLQGGQTAADRGMLERRGDDVPADMP